MPENVGRPEGSVSASKAAKRLGINYRTVQNRIDDGDLPGGMAMRGNKPEWYVWPEALPPEPASKANEKQRAVAAPVSERTSLEVQLQAQVDDLRAELAAAWEANRVLRDKQESYEAVIADYRAGAAESDVREEAYEEIIEGYRKLSASNGRAKRSYRGAADKLADLAGVDREAIGQLVGPRHLGDLAVSADPTASVVQDQ
ncbi:hypothetical protein [Mycobacteroides salmoniphilum]|uniref:Uncharacterized protein n=1 Tax=Mycobacteroides salmoniphilum TaxID=404941 RepID=A0A4R8SZZ1_9MYCO|nr:hypothetical protein [Mycobacteroides salmoniphilum]TEA09210.1 hypothetical protein CCUG60884_00200 [Mycobacteroides salmoniphilum]